MGIYYDKNRDKFVARATINGKRTYLGRYDTRAEAEFVVLQHKPVDSSIYTIQFDEADIKPGLLARFFNKFSSKKS